MLPDAIKAGIVAMVRAAQLANALCPYQIGKSLRWDAAELRQWIEDGCPAVELQ